MSARVEYLTAFCVLTVAQLGDARSPALLDTAAIMRLPAARLRTARNTVKTRPHAPRNKNPSILLSVRYIQCTLVGFARQGLNGRVCAHCKYPDFNTFFLTIGLLCSLTTLWYSLRYSGVYIRYTFRKYRYNIMYIFKYIILNHSFGDFLKTDM